MILFQILLFATLNREPHKVAVIKKVGIEKGIPISVTATVVCCSCCYRYRSQCCFSYHCYNNIGFIFA